ncbi:uncharacterized protein BT62DRAFT_893644, partial [Guyanagaster necrorhizus]
PHDVKDPRLTKNAAEDFLSREKRLDVLSESHISTFLFTQTLLSLMIETSKMPDSDVRLVNVASNAHLNGPSANPDIRFQSIDDFNGEYKEMFWPDSGRYGVSKLMNVIYTTELQRRLSTKSIPITCISLHPGSVDTGWAWRAPYPRLATIVFKIFFIGPDQGAYTSCFAAASPLVKADPDKYKGQYIRPVGRIVAKNPNVAKAGLAEGDDWEVFAGAGFIQAYVGVVVSSTGSNCFTYGILKTTSQRHFGSQRSGIRTSYLSTAKPSRVLACCAPGSCCLTSS